MPDGHQEDRRGDGEEHVRKGGQRELHRPLLDAEQRRELLVVHLRPEADERRANEARRHPVQRMRDRSREHEPGDETRGRHRHREPEGRADDDHPLVGSTRVEVEAEERRRDSCAKDDHEDRRQRDERLDRSVIRRRQIVRVERQQQDGENPRDEPADAVDEGVTAESLELRGETHNDL